MKEGRVEKGGGWRSNGEVGKTWTKSSRECIRQREIEGKMGRGLARGHGIAESPGCSGTGHHECEGTEI